MSHGSHPITTITTLPNKLYVVGLSKDEVPKKMHSLFNLLFLTHSDNEDHRLFVSFLETPYEVSLVLDEESLKLFPEGFLNICEKPWRAIQFSLGASPLETEGFIRVITAPLGKSGISIFHISTFNTDYILVEDEKFEAAKDCLKANFNIVWSEEEVTYANSNTSITRSTSGSLDFKNTPAPLPPITIPSTTPSHPSIAMRSAKDSQPSSTINQLQSLPDLSLYLTCIRIDQVQQCIKELIQLLFYPREAFRFISFTQAEDEVSLILDSNSLSLLSKENLEVMLQDAWIPIKRQKKEGLNETGVVSAISAPLTNLSVLYLSSYQTGYILVRQVDYTSALEKLQSGGFKITPILSKKQ